MMCFFFWLPYDVLHAPTMAHIHQAQSSRTLEELTTTIQILPLGIMKAIQE